ncbi:adenylyl-sulfate kinase [Cupriavidus basilensis]|uniref:adenylyl-sulfate kinase n=1 Tax=Cupriavidus basilensis TaxID=68895 RepID=UPI00284082FD|nr:adenylyl-sulfate kinase [Cupriavidus basilensis]MDR3383538.1 adenylyl-sulfate kinase [Cupriavidus basilensis]
MIAQPDAKYRITYSMQLMPNLLPGIGHRQGTIWITGLSGAGKTTLSHALRKRMLAAGHPVLLLDGDEMRAGLNRDLGFSDADRTENIRRAAEVAKLANRSGLWVVAAFISPLRSQRQQAREIIGSDAFLEVFLSASFAVCAQRDAKGLYAKASAGQISQFTGLSAPYEAPFAPDLEIDTEVVGPEQAADLICEALARSSARGTLSATRPLPR